MGLKNAEAGKKAGGLLLATQKYLTLLYLSLIAGSSLFLACKKPECKSLTQDLHEIPPVSSL